ncbi:cyclic beta 1-2 glucan synthetase [Hydrogenophaga sp. PAMC20947]|nr:cyclic beta 1-2 glucan synthetase [Hydrogenophaga sp. PAMC20947]
MLTGTRSLTTRIREARVWWERLRAGTAEGTATTEDEPLRAELFSADQMALHGKRLAAAHVVADARLTDQLLDRLASNERVLVELGKRLASTADAERRFTPAAEWLLDNFYLIEEEIRTARRHLPRGYSHELPQLTIDPANGIVAGLPRVYALALQAVAHGDGQIGRGSWSRFVAAYQSVQPLLLGELWACPIMLRLALIENLRRVAARVATAHTERQTAGIWADHMLDVAEKTPSKLILVVADMARSTPPLTNAFVAEFARRLQGRGAGLALPLTWMEQRLAESHQTIEQLVQAEGQQQAANQVSVSHSIGSLRLLGAIDWREFVEMLSSVEQALRDDPSGVYAQMEFSTRDSYRHAVEAIARLAPCSETEVARQAVDLCSASAVARPGESADSAQEQDARQAHVGYFLIGAGRAAFEQAVGMRRSLRLKVARSARAKALPLYAGSIVLGTLALSAGALLEVRPALQWPWWGEFALAGVLLLASSQLVVSLVNWLATLIVAPQPLPRMNYAYGIPPQARTLVVVPTMLGSIAGVEELVDALEVRFLANRDERLHFGLLTDLYDAAQEHLPGDAALVELAATRIAALNAKYRVPSETQRDDDFFLFHRPRRWNERERVWMGKERKRGKLADLNALLRGHASVGAGERFERIVGDTRVLSAVRYVITLDTDTQLPRDAAVQFVAAMAHPLNRPRFGVGAQADIVVEGYGILQPRVALSLVSANRTGYARLHGGETGIDPYTRAVSDVYQDLFGEGSFVGKGIYDVDVFERALGHSMPENRILSHDLLEGCYARAGLLSEVQLIEDAPLRYSADVARRYRWIRGDWQLLGWLRRRLHAVPPAPPNPLSWLSRAKIFDNLRRSLAPAAMLLMLLAAWGLMPQPGRWTLYVLAVVAGVPLSAHLAAWLRRPLQRLRAEEPTSAAAPLTRQAQVLLMQTLQTLACLPYEVVYSLGAITRTLWRVLLSKRRLLEWRPSADVRVATAPGSWPDLLQGARRMAFGPALAITSGVGLALLRPTALAVAAPVLLLWFLSPLLVWWIDRPLQRERAALTRAQTTFLRRLARRTWAFFETHVGAADNHLPPDNVQEHPVARIAHRTSPTNMGFALLAGLAARDFGHIGTRQLLARTDAALKTMQGLERHRGHFFNWYDTQTLQPLRPHYVSTVDSGNLAGQLLVLRSGLLALADEPVLARGWREGVEDSFGVLTESLADSLATRNAALPAALAQFEALLQQHRNTPPLALREWHTMLDGFDRGAVAILGLIDTAAPSPDCRADSVAETADPSDIDIEGDDGRYWARLLFRQCRQARDDWRALVPLGTRNDEAGDGTPTLRQIAVHPVPEGDTGSARAGWTSAGLAQELLYAIEDLAARAGALAEMEQDFLYDDARHLMAIGYNVDERRLDSGYYDLLASEARLGIFVAIAQGQIKQESWFALGRLLTRAAGAPVLLSWSGSMFEYLMPMLVMPSYENTLLDQTCHGAVQRQIEYGAQRGVPWGISESGYNATDAELNYQYRAFGVPGLGLKRGLADDLVVAPYASVMSLMVAPGAACDNLQRLAAAGAAGRHGLYEAIDYTATRLPRGQACAVVRSFMAHHQGMGLLALAHLLLERPMQRHFEADQRLKATLPLLQERAPRGALLSPDIDARVGLHDTVPANQTPIRIINTADTDAPEVQLLSNGRYHVMVTNAGGGYSRWKDLDVSRWREDATRDAWGSFCYLRDVASGDCWSTTYQPTRQSGEKYEAIFTDGRAEFRRHDEGMDTHTEIAVSPEDDIELRRLHITNNSPVRRTIEITSCTEVVLAPAAADVLHPAFSKLFVQTEIVERPAVVLCTRRPRSPDDATPWMFQLMAVHGLRESTGGPALVGAISHETDRARFVGRGNDLQTPQALRTAGPLSNSVGSVLDPIVASRCVITLAPGQSVIVDLVIGAGDSRSGCLSLAEKYQDRRLADRVFELAWAHAQVVLRQLNASEADAQLYARLAGMVIYAQSTLRADASVLLRNRRGQSGLWGYAISGDLPIVLLQIGSAGNTELVRQLVQAHAWWRLKGLAVDLVIWNEEHDIYRQRLQEQIMGMIAAGVEAHVIDRPGGIFVRHVEQIAQDDRILLQSVARVVFSDDRGSLAEQMNRRPPRARRIGPFVPSSGAELGADPVPSQARLDAARPELGLHNGIGGFSTDGREYVVAPSTGARPPAPWVNVLANPRFGSVISEAGSAYTWCENAHELRLTPWHNDPVGDASGEAVYIRDEDSGEVWSPTSLPCAPAGSAGPFITRHGFGYSVFAHMAHGIEAELQVFVALDAAVKFSKLRLTNWSGRPRKLSATGYVEWVLGDLRAKTAPHVQTDVARDSGAIYARNPYSNDYGDWIGFFDVDDAQRRAGSFTCDRAEFVGRNGSMREPAALARLRLSGRYGAALDPCAAIQVPMDLQDGETGEVVFRLGMGRSPDEAGQLIERFRGAQAAELALEAVQSHWRRALGAVQVHTPDPALNVLANGWLLYQTIACRMWARSGYYQSGGAFGFRDQLQDALALVHSEPQMLRAQLLLCASRQFVEGDVQHWWHPPQGRGVRTRISDDYLWLPLALARYVEATGDTGVLEQNVPFLEGRPVNPQDDSWYDMPSPSPDSASLYQHALRALWHGLRFGEHGLPLMGSGDWNDGMNLVGHGGRGESVWLGFFLCEALSRFGELARRQSDDESAARCEIERARLQMQLETHGWDGAWYRRAYFDDGAPLGSAGNEECQIDSIAQSWSVLSGIAAPERAHQAMDSMHARLVNAPSRLVLLLDPPFDQNGPNPGYIAGYVPGVRENGGQYTHGAIWAAMAFAKLGQSERAWSLFDIINPVNHAGTPEGVARYKVEPYVMAADVYSVAPHTGRGGWSWYTGSAGWMYRLIVESLLGLRLVSSPDGVRLMLSPCLPAQWPGYSLEYRYRQTLYRIEVVQASQDDGATGVRLDGELSLDGSVTLLDDGRPHRVEARLPAASRTT